MGDDTQIFERTSPLSGALIWINTVWSLRPFTDLMLKDQWPPDKWLPVSIAPFDTDLEVAVLDKRGVHALIFPCRRTTNSWVDATTQRRLDIEPTHWRKWIENRS